MSNSLNVLIVEDNPDDAELLLLALERGGYDPIFERVEDRATMEAALDRQKWDVILADYTLPQYGAMQALKLIREKGLDIPFIIVSGSIGEETAIAAMKAGVHDYLLKDNLARLIPAIEREIGEARVRRERREALKHIERLAFYDELTGLPNKASFLETLRGAIENLSADPLSSFAIAFLRVDRYNRIKYGFGHQKADSLMKQIATRMESCVGVPVARVGECEFTLLWVPCENVTDLEATIATLHDQLKLPYAIEESLIYTSVSIGIVDSTVGYRHPEDFLRAADTATHNAQQRGPGQTVVFNCQMQVAEQQRLQLEIDLQQAIELQQLQVNYQPIICIPTNEVCGFEALVRWHHPRQGWICPSKFIPVAEQTGFIVPLGEWVLATACRDLQEWTQIWSDRPPLSLSVNLSGIQIVDPQFLNRLDQIYPPDRANSFPLKLEITESILMENMGGVTDVIHQLKNRNLQICIDDFGTGYSSLAYLHYLPIDLLKIDRSFISQMTRYNKNFDIVRAIVVLAHALGIRVVAEGVETEAQLNLLRSLRCDFGQGYLFAKPLPSDSVLPWLQRWKGWKPSHPSTTKNPPLKFSTL